MPSSISSSEALLGAGGAALRESGDRYARQTAADRPGIAQPVPVRPVPMQPWGRILAGTVLLLVLMMAGWEWQWRAFGAHPSVGNTEGLWAIQRRRIDAGEGDATVLLGSSRLYFDMQLPVWERLDGKRPIQLSFEGTSPVTALEDLADDPKFTGRLLVGVAPDLFFSGFALHDGAARYARKESPSQRVGQRLAMNFIEPYFAFDDPDFALQTVLARQAWPLRPGKTPSISVRKLAETEADRNAYLWSKVADDPQYRALAQRIWLQVFVPGPDDPTPAHALKAENEQIARAAAAVKKLRTRGVRVLFVRMPTIGPYLAFENKEYPRARSWNALLAATGAPGIHFEDYPQLRPDVQGYNLPEWSHMTRADAARFTAALYGIIQREFWGAHATAADGSSAGHVAAAPQTMAPH
jgi:hypothetical protein